MFRSLLFRGSCLSHTPRGTVSENTPLLMQTDSFEDPSIVLREDTLNRQLLQDFPLLETAPSTDSVRLQLTGTQKRIEVFSYDKRSQRYQIQQPGTHNRQHRFLYKTKDEITTQLIVGGNGEKPLSDLEISTFLETKFTPPGSKYPCISDISIQKKRWFRKPPTITITIRHAEWRFKQLPINGIFENTFLTTEALAKQLYTDFPLLVQIRMQDGSIRLKLPMGNKSMKVRNYIPETKCYLLPSFGVYSRPSGIYHLKTKEDITEQFVVGGRGEDGITDEQVAHFLKLKYTDPSKTKSDIVSVEIKRLKDDSIVEISATFKNGSIETIPINSFFDTR